MQSGRAPLMLQLPSGSGLREARRPPSSPRRGGGVVHSCPRALLPFRGRRTSSRWKKGACGQECCCPLRAKAALLLPRPCSGVRATTTTKRGYPAPLSTPLVFSALRAVSFTEPLPSPTGRGVWFPFFLTAFYCQLRATVIGARVNKLHLCRSVLEQRAVLGTSLPFRLSRPRSVADHPSSCRLLQLQSCAIYRKDYPQD